MTDKNIEKKIQTLVNLFNTTNFDLVISKCKKLIKEFPEYVILYNILGSAYQKTGKLGLAKEIFVKGLKMDPNNIVIMNNLGTTYKNIGNIELSKDLFEKIIKIKPDYINAYINLGNLKRDINNFDSAIEEYNKALKINEQLPITLYSLALAYQGLGKFEKAIAYAKKTLLIDAKFTQADILISQCTKYKINNDAKHYKEMNNKINNLELDENQKINLHFAIAKADEDMDNIEKSFNHFDEGNKIKRKSLNFDINTEIKIFNSIKNTFNKIDFDKISNENLHKRKIIFVLGMPRSGTSLVEQIITSHSNVFGAGELPILSKIVQNELMDQDILSSDKVNNLIKDQSLIPQLRDEYYSYIKRFNSNEDFITDKAPLNFRWVGLIKILFPNSKIIHCSRDPKDNCLSLYKNLFEGGLNFSYDQKSLGVYYNLYLDLMNFWSKYFKNSIFEAKYEKIIINQEEETKKIIKFCELGWEDNGLLFYKNKSPIKTMSTAQARQPIYRTSINSYEKFSSFLGILNKLI